MNNDDRIYFGQRAKEERDRAARMPATDPAAIAHRQMAEEYERRIALGLGSGISSGYGRIATPD